MMRSFTLTLFVTQVSKPVHILVIRNKLYLVHPLNAKIRQFYEYVDFLHIFDLKAFIIKLNGTV